jgi:hypothetical protein
MIVDETVVNPPCPTCERPGRHHKDDRFICTTCITTWTVHGWSRRIMKEQLQDLMHELGIGSITSFSGKPRNCRECGAEIIKNKFGHYTGSRVSFATYRVAYYCENCVHTLKMTSLRQFEKDDYVKTPDNTFARIVGFTTSYCPILQFKGNPRLILVPAVKQYTTWVLEEFNDLPRISPDGILETMYYVTGKMTRWGLVAQQGKLGNYKYELDILNHLIVLTDDDKYSILTRDQVENLVNGTLLLEFEFDQEQVDKLAVIFGLKEAEDAEDNVCYS